MKTKVTLCCVALSVIFGNAAIAQKPTDPPAHPVRVATGTGFGTTSDTVVTLSARDMQPYEPGGGVTGGDDGFNYRWMTAGSNKLFIGGVNVPTGVTITGISIHYCDIDAASSFIVNLWDFYGDHQTQEPASFTAPDRTGCGYASLPVTYEWNSNAGHELMVYVFQNGPAVDGSIKFRDVQVSYRRKVSPGPATATFTDVPTTHLFYQYIEALASAGITAGCGGGNFCPDAAVTRGQMAVFLAKALGLHWAN